MKIGYEAKRVFHNKTGLGNYSRDLVRILAHFYPDNQYLLYNPKKNKEVLFQNASENVVEKLPPTPFYKKFYNLWRQKGILSDLVNDKVEIFHGLSGELPTGLKAKKIKSVVTIHDLIFMRYPNLYSFFDRKIHYLKFKKAANQADLVIAISEQTKEDIITYLKIPSEKIQVIYQGCQAVFKQNYSETEKEEVIQKFQLPKQFLLNVGTLEERKNAFSIVKAIKDLNIDLVLIGKETDYSKQIHEYCAANNLENRVHFLKGLTSKELAIVYQLAAIFIYPSVFEGFGIPIIEALFSKTPVITTNSGVFPEAGGPHSSYVNPMDVNALKSTIEALLQNEIQRKDMAEKGFEFVQKFNDEVIAKQLMQAYHDLF
jgi:glycosyltransferase involved in cell wall biosynthesis